jgi:hypothetical protein
MLGWDYRDAPPHPALRMPGFITFILCFSGYHNHFNKARKRNKRHGEQKERN